MLGMAPRLAAFTSWSSTSCGLHGCSGCDWGEPPAPPAKFTRALTPGRRSPAADRAEAPAGLTRKQEVVLVDPCLRCGVLDGRTNVGRDCGGQGGEIEGIAGAGGVFGIDVRAADPVADARTSIPNTPAQRPVVVHPAPPELGPPIRGPLFLRPDAA